MYMLIIYTTPSPMSMKPDILYYGRLKLPYLNTSWNNIRWSYITRCYDAGAILQIRPWPKLLSLKNKLLRENRRSCPVIKYYTLCEARVRHFQYLDWRTCDHTTIYTQRYIQRPASNVPTPKIHPTLLVRRICN